MESQLIWAPHPAEGYALGRVIDIKSGDTALVRFEPSSRARSNTPETVDVALSQVFPTELDLSRNHADNCSLMYLNEANLLNNIRLRYFKDEIYTYVANILIAVNPYHNLRTRLYSPEVLRSYHGKPFGKMPPHVFATADRAYHDIKRLSHSQSIIVSGESGAGKTESTKYILRYLCESFSSSDSQCEARGAIQIEQLILEANPLLEAFGNAKTARNNNSSRFGKFIEIHFDQKFSVAGGHILHYLLEKSRICGQIGEAERNYHIFYQLCAGLPEPLFTSCRLSSPSSFAYLRRGATCYFLDDQQARTLDASRRTDSFMNDAIVNDLDDFRAMDRALEHFGADHKRREMIYRIVAAILHLGNIEFEDSPEDSRGGCRVRPGDALENASNLLGVDREQLAQCLVSRIMQTNKGGYKGSIYMVPLKVHEAGAARDALAKAIYSRLFDFIVSKVINQALPGGAKGAHSIGVLDIAGFEYFQTNSFEQFCINYCNEKLQNFFNERILNDEQRVYEQESLGVKRIEYVDNCDCLELLEAKGVGVFDLLDEESRLPKPSATHFTEAVHRANKDRFRLDVPRKSKLRIHRELRDNEGFIVRHFAGAVCYQTSQFIEKNNDTLHTNLAYLMIESENELLRELFTTATSSAKGNVAGWASLAEKTVKLSAESVGGKFRKQLADLIAKLGSTGTHFVRCIKPNLNMIAGEFDGGCILSQLKCSGMASVLELMQYGFPSRATYAHIYELYGPRLPARLARLEPRHFTMALVRAIGLPVSDVRFGVTRVFFRPGRFAEFDSLLKTDADNLDRLIAKLARWLIQSRWRRAQYCALSVIKLHNKIAYRRACIVRIQTTLRMASDVRRYRPRYLARGQLSAMNKHLEQLASLAKQVANNKTAIEFEARFKNLEAMIVDLQHWLSLTNYSAKPPILSKSEIDQKLAGVRSQIEGFVQELKAKLAEQERLRLVQEQLEAERQKQEEQERREREAEELRRRRAELEERSRLEREQAVQEAARVSAIQERESPSDCAKEGAGGSYDSLTLNIDQEERARQAEALKRIEQEKRDYELALRLAQDNGRQKGTSGRSNAPGAGSQSLLNDDAAAAVQAAGYGSPPTTSKNELSRKYKLGDWNYAQLRDTINTSSDIELLEACREEFHRRLKVYHHWKFRNSFKTPASPCNDAQRAETTNGKMKPAPESGQTSLRAPASVMDSFYAGTKTRSTNAVVENGQERKLNAGREEQRYFRHPLDQSGTTLWYAHFNGKWIARQMEIHAHREPILLVAGKDDLQMCELSLEETGLTKKRGVEILAEQFEAEWKRNGGPSCTPRA